MTCPIHGCALEPFTHCMPCEDGVSAMSGHKCPKCEAKAAHRKAQHPDDEATHEAAYARRMGEGE